MVLEGSRLQFLIFVDGRLLGSWPETGFREVHRIGNDKSLVERVFRIAPVLRANRLEGQTTEIDLGSGC
jgi:hypothetical protein